MGFLHYRVIDKAGVEDNFVKGPDQSICYTCSLKLDPGKDRVIVACAFTEREDLRCIICDQIIKEDKTINEIHKVRDT